jgi:cytochrome c peroxidase
MRIMITSLLLLAGIAPCQETGKTPFPSVVPLGLPSKLPSPADNPLTEDAFVLGRQLFADPILSIDRTVSCASCHRPDRGFASPERFPPGVQGKRALRHAPTLLNRAFGKSHRWDGATPTLEEQVLLPIKDPNEMGLAIDEAVQRLRSQPTYQNHFQRIYGSDPTRRDLSRALASFVRGLLIGDSPFDRFLLGDREALSRSERAGMWIWESKGGCWRCHSRPNFTDEEFHNTGVGVTDGQAEPGRAAVTGKPEDRGKFKVPTLRGLTRTAPYMHDGSLPTLEEVVEFYRRGGNRNPGLSTLLEALTLTDEEARNLVAFLRVLSRKAVATRK